MPSKIRLQRISDRIRNEMSSMLVMEVQDPRLSGVSITDVRVDRELAFADVYVSAVEGHERSKEILEGLHSATGFLRKELAARVELRAFPRLRFHWDPTPERADHIEKVLAELRENDPSLREDDPSLTATSLPENTEPPGESTEDEENGDGE
jgi:ribosome-binding factor A